MTEAKNSRKVLLAVLAHPDDETFGTGGTLALYARRGVQVYLICATRGEVGDVDPEYLQGFRSVAERREHELRCAAGKLGLAGVFFLDYRDSGMPGTQDNHHPQALAAAPLDEVAGKIVQFIRRLRPQVVITFDPIGGYSHPDHIAIHKATLRAFNKADDSGFAPGELAPFQPQKLYYYTIPRRFLRLAVRVMPLLGYDPHKFGRNKDIDLAGFADIDFPQDAVIDFSPVRELKDEASLCHASQGGPVMSRGLMGWVRRLTGNKEIYMRAYPPSQGGAPERDLFAGL